MQTPTSIPPTPAAPLVPPFSPAPSNPTPFVLAPFWPETTLHAFLIRELSVRRLNAIHSRLWVAGRAGNIRSLHRQKIIERDIVLTEQPDLHLVWYKSRIYIKPLPTFLLDHAFFAANLCSSVVPPEESSSLHASACGLLLSYTYLVRHESDLAIAIAKNLLPADMTWERWSTLAQEICTAIGDKNINKRYLYGELRMTRLNLLYRALLISSRGFHHGHTRYASFFRQNFGWLLLAFAYVTVVLAAMQTVLTSSLAAKNFDVQKVSYWFGVAVLLTVVVVVVLMLGILVGGFVSNLLSALGHGRRTLAKMDMSKIDIPGCGV